MLVECHRDLLTLDKSRGVACYARGLSTLKVFPRQLTSSAFAQGVAVVVGAISQVASDRLVHRVRFLKEV